MFQKLKQFKDMVSQAKQAKRIQDLLAQETTEGSALDGRVKIKVNGTMKILSCSIDATVLADRASLEQAVVTAANDAAERMQKVMATKASAGGELGDFFKRIPG